MKATDSPFLSALLQDYAKLEKYEQENNLDSLYTLFYVIKMHLYLTIKELVNDVDEVQRLEPALRLLKEKNFEELIKVMQNELVKSNFEQYIESTKKFKNSLAGKQ